MKKIIFTLALLVQVGISAMAANKEVAVVATARYNNVKVFQQAGTSTTILETINMDDKVEFVRRYNSQWAIVTVNGKTGYVLFSEIGQVRPTKNKKK